jgi:pimeloyl-ACP methyl ester carboxylesterase
MLAHFISIGEIRLHVLDWGGADNPPLFLLHGLGSSCHMFDFIAEPLTGRYRVFAPDQRGHGMSDKPTSGYDFETISRDLDRLADSLGYADKPLTLIGHSWGAYTVLYYAATRASRVAKAVLIDGGMRPLGDLFPTWDDAEVGLAPPPYINMTIDDIRAFIRKWQGKGFRPETEPLALTIFDLSDPSNVHAHLSRENNMKIARALWEFRPTDYYSQTRCPVLAVNAVEPGRDIDPDMMTYAHQAEEQADQIQVVWMHNTIHDIPWHRPQELSAILDAFL